MRPGNSATIALLTYRLHDSASVRAELHRLLAEG